MEPEDVDLEWDALHGFEDYVVDVDAIPTPDEPQYCDTRSPYRWFITTNEDDHAWRVTRNKVTSLVGGPQTYQAMYDQIKVIMPDNGGFLFLVGWTLYMDFTFANDPVDGSKTFYNALQDLRNRTTKIDRTPVRVLIWKNMLETNVKSDENSFEIHRINWLFYPGTGQFDRAARLDGGLSENIKGLVNVLGLNSRHQKIMVVHRGDKNVLVAFCGGVDINPDRVYEFDAKPGFTRPEFVKRPSVVIRNKLGEPFQTYRSSWEFPTKNVTQQGAPDHDVHLKIEGDAAYHLLRIAVRRWNAVSSSSADELDARAAKSLLDARAATALSSAVRGAASLDAAKGQPQEDRPHLVQIGHTSRAKYPYKAERSTAKAMFLHAIKTAESHIYIEDQYMWSEDAAKALNERLNQIKDLIVVILIPPTAYTEPALPLLEDDVSYKFRHNFYHLLTAGIDTDRVRICHLQHKDNPSKNPGTYVHSKTWIFDDEYVICGSANCNNRGWGADGWADNEVVAGVTDFKPSDSAIRFAKELRVKLWMRHLGGTESQHDDFGTAVHTHKVWDEGQGAGDYMVQAFRPNPRWSKYEVFESNVDFIVDPEKKHEVVTEYYEAAEEVAAATAQEFQRRKDEAARALQKKKEEAQKKADESARALQKKKEEAQKKADEAAQALQKEIRERSDWLNEKVEEGAESVEGAVESVRKWIGW